MFWFGLIVGAIVGGALGVGGMYLWKIKGKLQIKAEDFQKQVEDKAKEIIAAAKEITK